VLRRLAVGTQPDRLRPLAEELGMSQQDGSPSDSDSDYDLGDLEILLLIAETALGLSRNEADLGSPCSRSPTSPPTPPPGPDFVVRGDRGGRARAGAWRPRAGAA